MQHGGQRTALDAALHAGDIIFGKPRQARQLPLGKPGLAPQPVDHRGHGPLQCGYFFHARTIARPLTKYPYIYTDIRQAKNARNTTTRNTIDNEQSYFAPSAAKADARGVASERAAVRPQLAGNS